MWVPSLSHRVLLRQGRNFLVCYSSQHINGLGVVGEVWHTQRTSRSPALDLTGPFVLESLKGSRSPEGSGDERVQGPPSRSSVHPRAEVFF